MGFTSDVNYSIDCRFVNYVNGGCQGRPPTIEMFKQRTSITLPIEKFGIPIAIWFFTVCRQEIGPSASEIATKVSQDDASCTKSSSARCARPHSRPVAVVCILRAHVLPQFDLQLEPGRLQEQCP